ncbi:MAG: hypothetical protein EOO18_10590 [Chryseobacterium sp.]|nr:MAG: hypothetical protein EOO18_10590 [Chryseobacterium sp.]
MLSYQPKWIPNLYIGVDRSFYVYRKDMARSFKGYFPIFTATLKKTITFVGETENVTEEAVNQDQYFSAYARWVLPEAKAEVYFQFGRNDFSYDMRDFMLEPESSRAYIAGLRKLVALPQKDTYIQLGVIALFLIIFLGSLHAQEKQIIEIKKIEKTGSSIIIYGFAKLVPPGTKMWVTVQRINGKSIEERHMIKTVDDVFTNDDGSFTATLKRYGSLNGFNFPEGKYQLEFYAGFSRAWQTIEVAKKAGVKLDEHGRSDLGEPHLLPKSSDLVAQNFGGEKVRFLRAIRTITISTSNAATSAYKTKSIKLEIHDYQAKNNPVRTINATELLFREVASKVGRLKSTEAVALICVGDFNNGFGYLANDLYFSGGKFNSEFTVGHATTLAELCHQQEGAFSRKQRLRS